MPDTDDGSEASAEDERVAASRNEVAFAEMENRVRDMIVELLSPTVRKCAMQGTEIENMRGAVTQHTKKLDDMFFMQNKALETSAMLDHFREEISKNEMKLYQSAAKVHEDVRLLRLELEELSKSGEQKESAIRHVQRSLDRVALEMNRLQDKQDDIGGQCEKSISDQKRDMHRGHCELESKIRGIEMRHHALTDELWGEETGLAKVTGELWKTNTKVKELSEAVTFMQSDKAEVKDLVKLRSDVEAMLKRAETDMSQLKYAVGNLVNDTREHLRTAMETVASHNAHFISEVRESYREELQQQAQLRTEVEALVGEMRESVSCIDSRVLENFGRTEALLSEQRESIEELDRKRKRDRTSADLELKSIKKRLGGVFDNSDAVLRGLEHLTTVLGALIDAASMQCALDVQDASDRDQVSLLGLREEPNQPSVASPNCSPPTAAMKRMNGAPSPRQKKKGIGGKEVLHVDSRCLSCSFQAPTVLTAFKMACLQYNPSPVAFDGNLHVREDLLRHVEEALSRAHGLFLAGPQRPGMQDGMEGAEADDSATDNGCSVKSGQGPLADFAAAAQFTARGEQNSMKLPHLREKGGGGGGHYNPLSPKLSLRQTTGAAATFG